MAQQYLTLLLLIPSLLGAIAIILAILIKRENKLLSRQLTETCVALEATKKQFAQLEENQARINEFQDSLKMAALTTRLQEPRIEKMTKRLIKAARRRSSKNRYSAI